MSTRQAENAPTAFPFFMFMSTTCWEEVCVQRRAHAEILVIKQGIIIYGRADNRREGARLKRTARVAGAKKISAASIDWHANAPRCRVLVKTAAAHINYARAICFEFLLQPFALNKIIIIFAPSAPRRSFAQFGY
jgi:hypothetical protein